MSDELDDRLRRRLRALSEAVPTAEQALPGRNEITGLRPGRPTSALRGVAGMLLVALLAVIALSRLTGSSPREAGSSATIPSSGAGPSASASQDVADVAISCNVPVVTCRRALPATLGAIQRLGYPPTNITFAQPMLCSDPAFLDGPAKGGCALNAPARASQALTHAVVTFSGVQEWAYLNIWAGPVSTIADLIAVRTAPAYADGGNGSSPPTTVLGLESPPPGGIARDAAIALASQHVTLTGVVSAEAGPLADLNDNPDIAPGAVKGDRIVWAVRFDGNTTVCDHAGVCSSPIAAVATTFLDFYTGAFILTESQTK